MRAWGGQLRISLRSVRWGSGRLAVLAVLIGAVTVPAAASAHLERASYWPDPRPDTGVTPPAGGEVPKARSLASAVSGHGPGEVRVVCRGANAAVSMQRLRTAVRSARKHGFRLRPSQAKTFYTREDAKRILRINEALARQCEYHTIQEAVNDSGNNDRVVIMPGRYAERPSRRKPKNDPRCADLVQDNGSGGMAPSYRYQTTCPNDQNLIYVQGRAVPDEPPPSPPLAEREGIPDLGRCLRCNLQIEGSGVKPTDVVMDAGKNYKRMAPGSKPGQAHGCDFQPDCTYAKDVVLRVDRADGFVARNFLTKSSLEHGLYIEEVDGYLLDSTDFFWSAEYGNLTFTSDHGLYKNCDAFGAGDGAIYPGAAPETGADVEDRSFYPDAPRINTVVKHCDLRSSALAYSGSQGNAVRITHNEIYANTTGIVSDSASASGHPGYPPDSIEIDHNNIYSNNLDSYDDPPFVNTVGLPMGVGNVWPGVNESSVHDNYIFDNWRRGTMLFAIPEGLTRGDPVDPSPSGCENPEVMTSCGDEYYDNVMGQAPPGFKPSVAVGKFGNPSSLDGSVANGVDFWWDEFAGNTGNCWHDNVGPDGTRASLNSDPPIGPAANTNVPGFLPEVCDPNAATYPAGVGTGDPAKEAVLVSCALSYEDGDTAADHPGCDWFTEPPEPGTAAARRAQRNYERVMRRFEKTRAYDRLSSRIEALKNGAVPHAVALGMSSTDVQEPAKAAEGVTGVGSIRAGSVAQLAQCSDWNRGTRPERLATIADIRAQVNQAGADGPTPDLTDAGAYALFERACSRDYARGFRLYKLYLRAASFGALAE
jgi:hypothetical protein